MLPLIYCKTNYVFVTLIKLVSQCRKSDRNIKSQNKFTAVTRPELDVKVHQSDMSVITVSLMKVEVSPVIEKKREKKNMARIIIIIMSYTCNMIFHVM